MLPSLLTKGHVLMKVGDLVRVSRAAGAGAGGPGCAGQIPWACVKRPYTTGASPSLYSLMHNLSSEVF